MALNCKPGDLAVYVGIDSPKDLGAIVQCVEFIGNKSIVSGGTADVWCVDRPLKHSKATEKSWIADCALRPIRDNPGQDESLTWAPVPHKEKA